MIRLAWGSLDGRFPIVRQPGDDLVKVAPLEIQLVPRGQGACTPNGGLDHHLIYGFPLVPAMSTLMANIPGSSRIMTRRLVRKKSGDFITSFFAIGCAILRLLRDDALSPETT